MRQWSVIVCRMPRGLPRWAFLDKPPHMKISQSRFLQCQSGGTAVVFALTMTTLLMITGAGIDYARFASIKSEMQSTADATVVFSARSITIAQSDQTAVESLAIYYVQSNAEDPVSQSDIKVAIDIKARSVTVDMALQPDVYFYTPFQGKSVSVTATAQVYGSMPVCVLGLDDALMGTITLRQSARLTAENCMVYSNSTRSNSVTVDSGGRLEAGLVCSAGGGSGDIRPELTQDCPVLPDPLAGRPIPDSGFCDETDRAIGMQKSFMTSTLGQMFSTGGEVLPELRAGDTAPSTVDAMDSGSSSEVPAPDYSEADTVILNPGVYCGGLLIGGGKNVLLNPGVYVIKDGPLYVSEGARLAGTNVGFFFAGDDATLYFDSSSSISLSAPVEGLLAGLLFFEDPAARDARLFSILSDDARELTGTIYLPGGTLVIDADRPIADQSAYTAIVARRLALYAGPHLVLNTDYGATEVPVPIEADFNKTIRLIN